FADFEALKRTAAKETTVNRHRDDIPGLIASASAVVCMGGYNTLSEVMATATPALVVPRNSHRAEQPRRAEALAAVGAVDTCAFSEVSVAALNDWFGDRVGHSIDRSNVDLAGLQTIAHLAAELIGTDAETIGTDSAAASRGSITSIKEIRYAG
ncbi:MAG: glycosyl transferase, partial [Brevibacterium aurantiacum]|nr:glycosyl transferase [Brevibacterium aurantiacum]